MTDDRAFARSLFTPDSPEAEPEPERTSGNHVPGEGSGNGQQRPTDYDDRNFAGALFGADENNRNLHRDKE